MRTDNYNNGPNNNRGGFNSNNNGNNSGSGGYGTGFANRAGKVDLRILLPSKVYF
jgi:hypothetical protein